MKLQFSSPARLGWVVAAAAFLLLAAVVAYAADAKFEAQLIWGTNEAKPKDDKLKPVDEDVRKKLSELPLKWTHYYKVNQKTLRIAEGATQKETMSEKCIVEIKNKGSEVEVSLYGRGERVWKRTQPLPKREILVVGGNAPNSTSWLVTLKRLE